MQRNIRPGPTESRAGISDVASLAGVSQGTVSNVLNHPDRVTEETRGRVVRAMQMLSYVPNGLARSLAAGTSTTLGLVVTDLSNSLFIDIARGAEGAADLTGVSVMLANSDGRLDREERYLSLFAESRFAGILMTLNDEHHFAAITATATGRTPLVLLNFDAPVSRFCSASVDNELGGYLAAQHLLELGRRRLVFVGGPHELKPVDDRGRGFRRALRERGLTGARELMPKRINRADGWEIGLALAASISSGEVDGIFASSDLLAAGIVQALAGVPGISIPEDVAIVGFDNNQAAWDSPIPITTVSQPGEGVGRTGAELVQAEAKELTSDHQHRSVVLAPELVIRRSTALQSS
ncbi:LacI family DNA-binding transcriptional regulator [Cellulomonas sp. URHD0024]|uniref:LacI family DNA-binding transcriptional regulator n=1 Tax=Cellulomonas sp. URHD0024 TaxID=1302620 RepID=UPI001E3E5677|nr:LacI family DNA-binding transcriptional regulator [Cellulomonas sp. URHD0024]